MLKIAVKFSNKFCPISRFCHRQKSEIRNIIKTAAHIVFCLESEANVWYNRCKGAYNHDF